MLVVLYIELMMIVLLVWVLMLRACTRCPHARAHAAGTRTHTHRLRTCLLRRTTAPLPSFTVLPHRLAPARATSIDYTAHHTTTSASALTRTWYAHNCRSSLVLLANRSAAYCPAWMDRTFACCRYQLQRHSHLYAWASFASDSVFCNKTPRYPGVLRASPSPGTHLRLPRHL